MKQPCFPLCIGSDHALRMSDQTLLATILGRVLVTLDARECRQIILVWSFWRFVLAPCEVW